LVAPEEPATAVRVHRSRRAPGTIVVVIAGTTAHVDVADVCARLCSLLQEDDAGLVVCDVSAIVAPDAVTVDTLARLALTARRVGRPFRLRHASRDLRMLLSFLGLTEAVCLDPDGG
jgi:hypothetical protein